MRKKGKSPYFLLSFLLICFFSFNVFGQVENQRSWEKDGKYLLSVYKIDYQKKFYEKLTDYTKEANEIKTLYNNDGVNKLVELDKLDQKSGFRERVDAMKASDVAISSFDKFGDIFVEGEKNSLFEYNLYVKFANQSILKEEKMLADSYFAKADVKARLNGTFTKISLSRAKIHMNGYNMTKINDSLSFEKYLVKLWNESLSKAVQNRSFISFQTLIPEIRPKVIAEFRRLNRLLMDENKEAKRKEKSARQEAEITGRAKKAGIDSMKVVELIRLQRVYDKEVRENQAANSQDSPLMAIGIVTKPKSKIVQEFREGIAKTLSLQEFSKMYDDRFTQWAQKETERKMLEITKSYKLNEVQQIEFRRIYFGYYYDFLLLKEYYAHDMKLRKQKRRLSQMAYEIELREKIKVYELVVKSNSTFEW